VISKLGSIIQERPAMAKKKKKKEEKRDVEKKKKYGESRCLF
jgi:hypothetical protein